MSWWRGSSRPTTRPMPRAGAEPKIECQALSRALKRRTGPMQIEVIVRSALWQKRRTAVSVVKKAVLAAAKAASTAPAELAIVLSNDSTIRALNRDWRGKNTPTNVLSFPAAPDFSAQKAGPRRGGGKSQAPSPYIGDIVIAYQTPPRQPVPQANRFPHHLAPL